MFDEIKGNKIVYRSDYTYRIGNILIYHYENLKYSYSTFKLSITLHTIKANKTIVNNIYYLITFNETMNNPMKIYVYWHILIDETKYTYFTFHM